MQWEINLLNNLGKIHNPFLDKIMQAMSFLGSGGLIFILIGTFLLMRKEDRKLGFTIAFSLLLCGIIGNGILKPLIARTRPYIAYNIPIIVKPPTGYSFPSGHTYSAFAAAIAVYKYKKNFGIFLFLFAILMGFSRMYLFVHYPTDVLAGAVLGIVIGNLSYNIIDKVIKVED